MSCVLWGWQDIGTSPESYYVEGPYSVSGRLGRVGSIDDDIQVKWNDSEHIEAYNSSTRDWWKYERCYNNWAMKDTKWIGENASLQQRPIRNSC